jgi:hypothetical protein
LIEEVEDFKLDSGDIFSDFLGLEEPVDKASFFEQFMGEKNEEQDSFELEIESRGKGNLTKKGDDLSEKKNGLLLDLEEFPFLEEGDLGKNAKNLDSETKINSGGNYEIFSTGKKKFEIDCPSKKKMINEMFSFKVDVGKNCFGNRNRSQSYSIGHTNSIFDFLNKK